MALSLSLIHTAMDVRAELVSGKSGSRVVQSGSVSASDADELNLKGPGIALQRNLASIQNEDQGFAQVTNSSESIKVSQVEEGLSKSSPVQSLYVDQHLNAVQDQSGTLPNPSIDQSQVNQSDTSQSNTNQNNSIPTSLPQPMSTSNIALPKVSAEGAIVIDANTKEVLFEKNSNAQFYPASITKLLTAMVVLERSSLDSVVQFSRQATTNLESGAVTLGVMQGDQIRVKDSLYGMMLKSANEVANGLAEHAGGSMAGFAQLMNDKAKSLGATNSNFANPSGLNNPNHYTTAKDFALIASAAFDNMTLRQILGTTSYTFPAIKRNNAVNVTMGHRMIHAGNPNYYPGVIGGKTGYTSKAGNTLVTLAEKDGKRLVVVVLKANKTQYADTKAMLDYGFQVAKPAK